MADLGTTVCFCGHKTGVHGEQGCVAKMKSGEKCDCDGYIPVLAAIAQSLNTIATQLLEMKNVIGVATNVLKVPNRIIT